LGFELTYLAGFCYQLSDMLTKFASTVAIGLTLFFSAQSNLKAAEGATKFDGSWEATVDAKEHKNPDGSKALP
jgi:hypothetical protein